MAENVVCSLSPSCPFDQGSGTRVAAKMMALPAALHTLPCAHLPTRAGVPYSSTSALHSRPSSPPDKAQGSQGCKAGDAGCKARRGQEARCKAEQEKVGPAVSGHPHCQYVSPRTPSVSNLSRIFLKGCLERTRWARRRGCRFPESNAVRLSRPGGSKRIGSIASLK